MRTIRSLLRACLFSVACAATLAPTLAQDLVTFASCPGQPDGLACDDNNPCTLGETCRAGNCAPPSTVAQASGSPVPVGSSPISVAVGDFNGDGKLDLAVANQSSHNVTILLGDGVGGFAPTAGSPVAAGTNPVSIAVGDINGDGKLDLVVANSSSNDATILLGNGAGAFAPAATSPLAVGASPRSVVARDWNGDGKLDLAVANRFSDFVTILLGDGAAGFTPAAGSPVSVGTSPFSLAAGDVNADGKLDLAVANNGANTVTILLGNGVGGFSPAVGSPVVVGTNPESVALADVSGDGKLDLATANAGSNDVSVLLGTGSGGLTPAAGSPLSVGVNPEFVGIADLNADGRPDLVVTNGSSNNVTLWLGNGSGGFGQAAGSPVAVGSNPVPVAVGDWTGDARLDLAVVNFSSSNLTILLNNTPAAPNGTACNDGTFCTQSSSCQSGTCTGSNPVICTALDQCHVVGTCAPATGVCSNPNAANGAACNDGNACTQTDTCQTGVCAGSNPVVCTPIDQCHVTGTCNTGTGICTNPNKANGSSCNDGNGCTQTDTCQTGACTGSNPVVCTAIDPCHVAGTCAPATGVCSNPNAANGTQCNDGNVCTASDLCNGGVCAGLPVPGPSEVDNGVRVAKSGADATISWNLAAGASSSAVLRGLIGGLPVGPGGGDESCLASGLSGAVSSLPDATGPAPNTGFWYLVRGDSTCGEGPYGFQAQHGTPTVPRTSTTCGIDCSGGSRDCDNNPANGCEVNLTSDAGNCGTCANVCPARANAGTSCGDGVCGFSCNSGFADCNTNPIDGCEVSTTNDLGNCSSCGVVCPNRPNAAPTCISSSCGIACNAGFVDCNANTIDGCEIGVDTDAINCGSCGAACSNNHIPVPSCGGGQCNGACAAGFADCNNNKRTDGCEVSTSGNLNNCGSCGNVCPTPANSARTCSGGACGYTCTNPFRDCDGNPSNGCEILTSTDVNNCGNCGQVCPPRPNAMSTCAAGACGFFCNAGFLNCNGTSIDGCEISTATDPNNCGSCGHVCPGGTPTCSGGTCH